MKKSADLLEKEKQRQLNTTYSMNDTQGQDETYNDSTNIGVLEALGDMQDEC